MCHLGACKAQSPGMAVLQNNILYTVASNHTFLLLCSTKSVSGRTDIQTDRAPAHRQTGHKQTSHKQTSHHSDRHSYLVLTYAMAAKFKIFCRGESTICGLF